MIHYNLSYPGEVDVNVGGVQQDQQTGGGAVGRRRKWMLTTVSRDYFHLVKDPVKCIKYSQDVSKKRCGKFRLSVYIPHAHFFFGELPTEMKCAPVIFGSPCEAIALQVGDKACSLSLFCRDFR